MPKIKQYMIYEVPLSQSRVKEYLICEHYDESLGMATEWECLGFKESEGRWHENYMDRNRRTEKFFKDIQNCAQRVYPATQEQLIAFKLSANVIKDKKKWLEEEKNKNITLSTLKNIIKMRSKQKEKPK